MKQFKKVSGRYGAPMGRDEYGIQENCLDKSISLFRVHLDGDYDDGGAYWGGGGLPLYCARGEDFQHFTRARSRWQAAKLLGLENCKLKRRV